MEAPENLENLDWMMGSATMVNSRLLKKLFFLYPYLNSAQSFKWCAHTI